MAAEARDKQITVQLTVPSEKQVKQSDPSLQESKGGVVISDQHSDSVAIASTVTESPADAHERHMQEFVRNMLESRRSSVIGDEKYDKIVRYLHDPENTKVSPQFKFWVTKERRMTIVTHEEGGETKETLVCYVPDFKKEHKHFDGITTLTIVPERDLFKTVKKIHEDINHSGYKKVMEYVELRYYGLPRTYVQEFCKTCPTCKDKTRCGSRRRKSALRPRSSNKQQCFEQEVIVTENIQAAVDSYTSGNYQTVVIEVQNPGEAFDVSALTQPTVTEIIQPQPSGSVVESDLMGRVQVEVIDMCMAPDGDFHYICHVMDHYSKYHILFPLKDRTPHELAAGLQRWLLAYFGPPRVIHSDSGRSFVHNALPLVVEQWPGNITFVKGKPTSQLVQELIAQANQVLEVELDNMKQEQLLQEGGAFHWTQHLPRIMFKLNTQKPSPTMDTPYGAVFRQQPKTTLLPGLGSRVISESQLERLITGITGSHT